MPNSLFFLESFDPILVTVSVDVFVYGFYDKVCTVAGLLQVGSWSDLLESLGPFFSGYLRLGNRRFYAVGSVGDLVKS